MGESENQMPEIECPACKEALKRFGKLPDYCSSCGVDRRAVVDIRLGELGQDYRMACEDEGA